MKKFIILIVLVVLSAIAVGAESGDRFTHIYSSQWIQSTGLNSRGGDKLFSAFRDNSTGNEIICVDESAGGALTCFLSGRKW